MTGVSLADSVVYGHLWATDEARALFDDRGRTQAWLDIVAALAAAEAELGLIPEAAARDMLESFEHRAILRVEALPNFFFAELAGERLEALQTLLDLHGVVGEQLRRRVDGGESAADDDRRQAHLQVRHRVALGRAGQLQGHQEVRGLAHAADEVVLHRDEGRLARPGRHRDVVEAQLPGVLNRERPAEAHAAVEAEAFAPRERQVLSLVVRGMLNKQIAADLGAAEKTIKIHRGRVMKKMQADSVATLVRMAQRLGLEEPRA